MQGGEIIVNYFIILFCLLSITSNLFVLCNWMCIKYPNPKNPHLTMVDNIRLNKSQEDPT